MTMKPQDLVEQLRWRYATQKFDPTKKIPAETWDALEHTLHLAPSSWGLQPWKFVVVTDPALRAQLLAASWNQKQIVEASHMVVFAYKKDLSVSHVERHIVHAAKVRGIPESELDSLKKMLVGFVGRAGKSFDINVWAKDQLYIALGCFLTAAAALGVDACPMEGIEPKKYDEILGLREEGYHSAVVATAGYRMADDKHAARPKIRFPKDEIITYR